MIFFSIDGIKKIRSEKKEAGNCQHKYVIKNLQENVKEHGPSRWHCGKPRGHTAGETVNLFPTELELFKLTKTFNHELWKFDAYTNNSWHNLSLKTQVSFRSNFDLRHFCN